MTQKESYDKIKKLEEDLNDIVAQITERCFELYGADDFERYARRITFDKEFDFISDPKLDELTGNLVALEREIDETNPFDKFVSVGGIDTQDQIK